MLPLPGDVLEERAKTALHSLASGDMCDPDDYLNDEMTIDVSEGPDEEQPAWRSRKVKKWRAAEMKLFHSIPVYEYVTGDVVANTPEAIVVDATWVDSMEKEKSRVIFWLALMCHFF